MLSTLQGTLKYRVLLGCSELSTYDQYYYSHSRDEELKLKEIRSLAQDPEKS